MARLNILGGGSDACRENGLDGSCLVDGGSARRGRANEMSEAIRRHKPLVGMSEAQLHEAMGVPTNVNANNVKGVQSAQVIYERPTESWHVYTTAGFVDSIQHRPGAPLAIAPAANAMWRAPAWGA